MATAPGGGFVVVWDSLGSGDSDTSGYSIHAQRYDSSGGAQGSEFEVNSYTTDYQFGPVVAVDPEGSILVVWTSRGSSGSDGSERSIQARRYRIRIFADGFESSDTSEWSAAVP